MDPNNILGLDLTRKRWSDVNTVYNDDIVLVTGASSFIGSHIVRLLLKQGYIVRGTVSSLKDDAIVLPLRAMARGAKHELELFEIDLLNTECWREPIKDCKYVIHTATPYPDEPLFGDEIDKADLSISAMSNLMESAVMYGNNLKRFVFTSTVGAVAGDVFEDGRTYTEQDWPENVDDLQPYIKSKVLSERFLWDYVHQRMDRKEKCFEIAVINPGFVLGPLLLKKTNKSLETIVDLLIRDHSMIPDIYLPVADVRDVALAHVRAIKLPESAFKRHIVVTKFECVSLKEIAKILDKEFYEYDVPTKVAPDFIIKFFSLFDKTLRTVTPSLGHKANFDNRRMHNILTIDATDLRKTILDTAHSLIEKKLVPEQ